MKKLILVLIMGFVFNLAFATSLDNDVGVKKDKIEYNQNLSVTVTAFNVVDAPFFSMLSESKTVKSVMYVDDITKGIFIVFTEVKLPDINNNIRCIKSLNLNYTNYKIGSSGGLSRS